MRKLGLNELVEAEKGAIWLINSSSEKYPSGAEVFITIVNGDQSSVFVMPRTWLPVEITARFPRKNVINSSYFVSAIADGLVSAIPEEEARALLSSPKAEREKTRLKGIEDAIREANASRGIGKNVSISTGDPEADANNQLVAETMGTKSQNFIAKANADAPGVNFEEDEPVDEVPANFKAWVIKLNGLGDTAEIENELRMRKNMSMPEAFYLLRNCDNDEIVEKLKKKLRKLGEDV